MGQLEDVTQTVLWLASDDASFISGQVINIDGGTSTRKLPSGADIARHFQAPTDAG
jgi:3-oxoacyl-[acyl-carrier protein] reductase